MNTKAVQWVRGLFFGRPLTKEDHLRERLRLCAAAGIHPESVENFWVGLEDLRGRIPPNVLTGQGGEIAPDSSREVHRLA